jgi:hypothetical protein
MSNRSVRLAAPENARHGFLFQKTISRRASGQISQPPCPVGTEMRSPNSSASALRAVTIARYGADWQRLAMPGPRPNSIVIGEV